MSKTNPTDLTEELQEAIRKLEEFSRHQSEKISLTPLQKTIDLVRGLIFSDHQENSLLSNGLKQTDVLEAIEVVNRKRLLIQKLKNVGSPSEKKLAESFLNAIDGFNTSLDQQKQKNENENQGIGKFFLKKEKQDGYKHLSKIDIPQQTTVRQHYPENSSSEWLSRRISPLPLASDSVHLSKQSTELFQMKVIALLERYGIASNPEARKFVKSSPIMTSVDEDRSRCILTQTITLFPGQTIVVKGSSELNPQTCTISKLFPETFCLLLQSTQTGFPHPSQRAGWTLANQLIPDCPQRPDLLSQLSNFYLNKKQAVQELLPQGSWVDKAKKIIKLKREAFIKDSRELIPLHRKLALAIAQAAPKEIVSADYEPFINTFYSCLEEHPSPFDFLSETHQIITDTYIGQPHSKLIEVIMKKETAKNESSLLSYEAAEQILSDELSLVFKKQNLHGEKLEQAQHHYINCMGRILGTSAKAIMLQYFSEDLIFLPPELNLFEKKLQRIAYQHASDFLSELSDEKTCSNRELIEWDIAQWEGNEENFVADELAQYFRKRHQHPTL